MEIERIKVMRRFGKLEDGSYICQLTADEVKKLQRREGVRKNRALSYASLKTIVADIERTYDLPSGSVRVYNPETNKPYRSDVRINTIRRNAE